MSDKTIPSDFRVDIGRADRGRTFVRVLHVPTGKDRTLVGIDGADVSDVALKLAEELAKEVGMKDSGTKRSSEPQKKRIVG
jgi:hypothetical protein